MRPSIPSRWHQARALGAAVILGLIVVTPAFAQSEPLKEAPRDQIVFTGRLTVTSDEAVDAAVIFDGPALVEGTVAGSLVVFNGDADVSGTVHGDVVVINGSAIVRSGAKIGGDLVTRRDPVVEQGATIDGERRRFTGFRIDRFGVASRVVWWVGYSISVLILGMVTLLFVRRLGDAAGRVIRERLGRSIGWGLGVFFLLPVSSLMLLVTVVGIPLGLFTLLALALIYTVGYVVATIAVGGRIKRSGSPYATFFVGWVVLRLLALIPVVGGVLWLAGSIWGLGLLAVVIREGSSPGDVVPLAPPPPPVPTAA